MPLSPQSVSPPGTALGSRSPSPGITPIPDRQHKGSFGVPFSKNGLVSPLNVASPSSVTQPPPSPNVSSQQQRERRSSLSQSESDDDEPIDFGLFGGDDESRAAHSRNNSTQRRAASLNSDSSGSEYGLAYADDTDEEDAASVVNTPGKTSALTNATTPKPTIPSKTSIMRSPSSASSTSSSVQGLTIRKKNSVSSSSGSSSGGLYGNKQDTDSKRNRDDIVSVSRYSKASSTYSRNLDINRATMNTVWEDRDNNDFSPSSPPSTPGGGLAALLARTAELEAREPTRDSMMSDATALGRPKAQRSNTFAHASPTQSTVKLPMRSRTERESGLLARRAARAEEEVVDANATPVQRKKRVRVCLRCEKKIEDGKWVKAENGGAGILCVKCWKNMYLPKVSSFCLLLLDLADDHCL